jgi:hypothetical protein
MNIDQLVAEFTTYITIAVDAEGIHPLPAWIITADDQRDILAVAMPTSDAVGHVLAHTARTADWQALLFGIDVFCKENQGTTLDSALVLVCVQRGLQPRVGVIEYSWNGGYPTVLPVNWDNQFWPARLESYWGVLPTARRLAGV